MQWGFGDGQRLLLKKERGGGEREALKLTLTSHVAVAPAAAAVASAAAGVCLLAGRPGLPVRPAVHHARLEEEHPGLPPTGPGGG